MMCEGGTRREESRNIEPQNIEPQNVEVKEAQGTRLKLLVIRLILAGSLPSPNGGRAGVGGD